MRAALRFHRWASIALIAAVGTYGSPNARAAYLTFRQYDQTFGLTSSDGFSLAQDGAGNLLSCTDQGLFAFDGRHFSSIGDAQGLRNGGFVFDATILADGRVALRDDRDVFVTDAPVRAGQPASRARFRKAVGRQGDLAGQQLHKLVKWRAGLAVLSDGLPQAVVVTAGGNARYAKIAYTAAERAMLTGGIALFSVHQRLWETLRGNRLCTADPGAVQCFGSAEGLPAEPVSDMIAKNAREVFARTATSIVTIDPASRLVSVSRLPDQSGRYAGYPLLLFRDPDGHLMTQSAHGLLLQTGNGWRELDAQDGVPDGIITAALVDRSGQLWIQVIGHGIFRSLGYGKWDAIPNASGLTEGVTWQTARLRNGPLLASTDTGLMSIERQDHGFQVTALTHDPSFPLLVTSTGAIWSSVGQNGVRVIDHGVTRVLASPAVNSMLEQPNGDVLLATQAGLYRDDPSRGDDAITTASSDRSPALDLIEDGHGGVFYLSADRLRHRDRNGREADVGGRWPQESFQPSAIALSPDGTLWVGGSGGLFRLRLENDRVVSWTATPETETSMSSSNSLLIDHRGWLWSGSDSGISVYDGHRWASATKFDGLIWNDVSQSGLSEDTDGSIWISTSEGLSHLREPAWLFERPAPGPVTTAISLGTRAIANGNRVPFSVEPLTVQFGTSDFGAEQSIVFRYRLSGVNEDWAESASGTVLYPTLPAGRHALSVYAFDTATALSSPVTTILVTMAYPWWRKWWAEASYAALGLGLFYALYRLRLRRIFARQRQLEQMVAERTREILATQVVLERLATTDALTGLLNRGEAERRVAASLETLEHDGDLVVALVDIDHFKQVNDRYGHLGGDEVLRSAGRLALDLLEEHEFACRVGGEEFLLVLRDGADEVTSRIRDFHRLIRATPMLFGNEMINITCSIGVARARPCDGWESLIGRADAALYRAKASGRNRIVDAPDERRSDRAILVG